MNLNINADIKPLLKNLNKSDTKVKFAIKDGIDSTLDLVKKAEIHQLKKDIDRPTPFTQNAFVVKKTRFNDVGFEGRVITKPIQEKYLMTQVYGGVVQAKRSYIGVPTKKADLNAYGNLKGRRSGLVKRRTDFIANVNNIRGVYRRVGKGENQKLDLIVGFERSVNYSKRFKFFEAGNRVVRNHLKKRLQIQINKKFKRQP
jgi:hypothetical protein